VEVATPDKAEVSNIADRLGITPEEAFGRLFRVWAWAQNVSVNGHVSVRSLSVVDSHARLPGFGQAMAEEGWLRAENNGMLVPNWDRHLSKGAKKRALDRHRKNAERENKVQEKSASGADKKRTRGRDRVNSPTKVGENATRLLKDWQLPKPWGEWALTEQPSWDAAHVRMVAAKFRDHWVAKAGKDGRKLDWEATWRNWVRNEGTKKNLAGGVIADTSAKGCFGCARKDKLVGSYGPRWYCADPACRDKARDS
jgi:hypothetical protein